MIKELRDRTFFISFLETHNKIEKLSLRGIERKFGLGNGTMSRWCKIHNVEPIALREIASIVAKRKVASGIGVGKNHWAWGLTKDTHAHYANMSKKMIENNPMQKRDIFSKMLLTNSKQQLDKNWLGEKTIEIFFNINEISGYDRQLIIGRSIRDFAFVKGMVVVEIDGRGHLSRFSTDLGKDLIAIEQGWVIIRCQFDNRSPRHDWTLLCNILKKLIPDFKFVNPDPPPPITKYWVLIRSLNNPAGFKCNDPNDPRLIELSHDRRDWLKSALVSKN